MERELWNYGPVVFANPFAVKVGDYLTFEEWPTLRARIMREATREEFLASRLERNDGHPADAGLLRRLTTAYFYEVHTD